MLVVKETNCSEICVGTILKLFLDTMTKNVILFTVHLMVDMSCVLQGTVCLNCLCRRRRSEGCKQLFAHAFLKQVAATTRSNCGITPDRVLVCLMLFTKHCVVLC